MSKSLTESVSEFLGESLSEGKYDYETPSEKKEREAQKKAHIAGLNRELTRLSGVPVNFTNDKILTRADVTKHHKPKAFKRVMFCIEGHKRINKSDDRPITRYKISMQWETKTGATGSVLFAFIFLTSDGKLHKGNS